MSESSRDRRRQPDRRAWTPSREYPFADSCGVVVTRDRRKRPDRRLNNIEVRWPDAQYEANPAPASGSKTRRA